MNTEARPWFSQTGGPRRAAVSAFGFGGSNFHCVLEEAEPAKTEIDWDGDVQILAFSAREPGALMAEIQAIEGLSDWAEMRRAARAAGKAFVTTNRAAWSLSPGAGEATCRHSSPPLERS